MSSRNLLTNETSAKKGPSGNSVNDARTPRTPWKIECASISSWKTRLTILLFSLFANQGLWGEEISTSGDCSPVITNVNNVTINCTYSLDGVDVDKKFTGAKYTFRSPAADGMEDYCVHEDTTMTKPMGYCSVYFVGKSVFDLPDGFESYLANYGQSQGGNNWDFVFLTGRYTGEMDNGLPQGQGTFIVTDTSGTLNLFNRTFGDGLFTDANSFLVDGNWDKGELVGEGRVQMGNGGVLTCEDFLFNVCQKGTVTRIPEHTFGLRYRWGPGFGNTGMTYTGPILGGRLHGQGRAIVKTTRDSMIYTLVETGEFFEDKLFNGTETYRNTFETIWRYTISEGQIIDD